MGKEDRAATVDQKVAARLVNVAVAIILAHQSFAKQLQVQLQRRQRKNPVPGKPFQAKRVIGCTLRIGKDGEAPLVMLLVVSQHRRLGKRDNRDLDLTPVEFLFECADLDEVSLAGQSGQVAVKDEQQPFVKIPGQRDRVAVEIEKPQLVNGDFFHEVITQGVYKRRRPLYSIFQ